MAKVKKCHPDWWQYILKSLRRYPEIHAVLESERTMSMTASYSGMPGGGGCDDPVFAAITKKCSVTPEQERMHDCIEQAMLQTRAEKNWKSRLRLVELVYFKQTETIKGAADLVHYSYDHSVTMIDEFIHQVAKNRGFE